MKPVWAWPGPAAGCSTWAPPTARQPAWAGGVVTGGAAAGGRVAGGVAGPGFAGPGPERPPWPAIWPTRITVVSAIATVASHHSATRCSRASVLDRRPAARCRGGCQCRPLPIPPESRGPRQRPANRRCPRGRRSSRRPGGPRSPAPSGGSWPAGGLQGRGGGDQPFPARRRSGSAALRAARARGCPPGQVHDPAGPRRPGWGTPSGPASPHLEAFTASRWRSGPQPVAVGEQGVVAAVADVWIIQL